MSKKLIIFSSQDKIANLFLDVVKGVEGDKEFYVSKKTSEILSRAGLPAKIVRVNFGKSLLDKTKFRDAIFGWTVIFLKLKFFFKFAFMSDKKDSTIIFLGMNEKIQLTKIAKIFKFNVVWLETQEINFQSLSRKNVKKYIGFLKKVKLGVLSNYLKNKIVALGVPEDRVVYIQPGLAIGSQKYQDNIFSNMAKQDHGLIGKKYYSIGTVNDFSERETLEFVFKAFAKSQHIITKSQLLVLNQKTPEQDVAKWSRWLAKKMEIDNMVWFINEANNLLRWLKSLDFLVINPNSFRPEFIQFAMIAMNAGLVVIVPEGIGFEDIIEDEKNGILYKLNDSDSLAEKMILVYKNRQLRINLQAKATAAIEEKYKLETARRKFIEFVL